MAAGFGALRREIMAGINRDAYAKVRRSALRIVNDLQARGPYWDGLFYHAWEVQPGDVTIPADQEGTMEFSGKAQAHPKEGSFKLTDIPKEKVTYERVPSLTIGNRMVYRDIALDLEPGRIKGGGNETAPQDWYVNYYAGGEMDQAVKATIRQNINLPGE